MGAFGGAVLRFGSLGLRFIQLCCAAVGVGIFSYFLAVLADHNIYIAKEWKAVEGLTAIATLYTLCAVLFTLCLGGNVFFGSLAAVFDLLFMGAFIAVAVLTREGAHSCKGIVNTPLGTGNSDVTSVDSTSSWVPKYGTACRLNTAVFAVSVVAAVLFLITAIWQIMMVRHHKKEKAYGPGPNNNYTSGSGKTPFWKRRQARGTRDTEAGVIGAGTGAGVAAHHHNRGSHETGTTLGNTAYTTEPKYNETIPAVPANNTFNTYNNDNTMYHNTATVPTPQARF